jgi:hypothetical protein
MKKGRRTDRRPLCYPSSIGAESGIRRHCLLIVQL